MSPLISASGGGVAARIAAAIFRDMCDRLGRTEPRPAATRGRVGPKAIVAAKPRIAMRANEKRVRSDPASKAGQSLQTRFRFATTHIEKTLEPNVSSRLYLTGLVFKIQLGMHAVC